jgi:xanthine dehydrogenase accessory factor
MSGSAGSSSVYEVLRDCLREAAPVALATIVDGAGVGGKLLIRPGLDVVGSLGDAELDRIVARDARAELEAGRSSTRRYGLHGETLDTDQDEGTTVTIFVESFAPPPQMVIFGAVDFTAALAKVAKVLGFRVTVCDARKVFATTRRFPMADSVIVDWPDRLLARIGDELGSRDAVCVLTHDPKFDVPAIVGSLASGVGYIGVMGSRKTHERRMDRLAEAGVTASQLQRVFAPIGIDIGARSPEETAISICAEIIARRTGRGVPSLRHGEGPIH